MIDLFLLSITLLYSCSFDLSALVFTLAKIFPISGL